MNYSEFLFCQLLQHNVEYYAELEYDLLFEQIPALYKEFENSKWNNLNNPSYECIEEYIKENDIGYNLKK